VPFPLIVLAAGAIGLAAAWRAPRPAATSSRHPAAGAASCRIGGLALWLIRCWPLRSPWAAIAVERLYVFFTQAALVTFGGAYAVLGYVTQHLVQDLGWLTATVRRRLALAETTPGPLVIVLQFMASWPAGTSPVR